MVRGLLLGPYGGGGGGEWDEGGGRGGGRLLLLHEAVDLEPVGPPPVPANPSEVIGDVQHNNIFDIRCPASIYSHSVICLAPCKNKLQLILFSLICYCFIPGAGLGHADDETLSEPTGLAGGPILLVHHTSEHRQVHCKNNLK